MQAIAPVSYTETAIIGADDPAIQAYDRVDGDVAMETFVDNVFDDSSEMAWGVCRRLILNC